MPYDVSMGALIRDAARVTTTAEQFARVVEDMVKADGRVSDGHKYEVDPAPLHAARITAWAVCEMMSEAMNQVDTAVDNGHWVMDDVIEWLDYDPNEVPPIEGEQERNSGGMILCGCTQCEAMREEMSEDYDRELSDDWW